MIEWRVLATVAENEFARAAERFQQVPNAESYVTLARAAITHQQMRFCPPEKREPILDAVGLVPFGSLSSWLVERITGKTLDDLIK